MAPEEPLAHRSRSDPGFCRVGLHVPLTRAPAIPGSLRKGSNNRAVLQADARLAPEGMEIDIHGLDGIPLFNADDEKANGFPPAVASLREALAEADAILIATPGYNFSVPGALENALDWLSRGPDSPLTGKLGAILGTAGHFGSVRAQSHLREILLHSVEPGPLPPVDDRSPTAQIRR